MTLDALRCIVEYPFNFLILYLLKDSPMCQGVTHNFLRSDTTNGLITSPLVPGRTYGNFLRTSLHTTTIGVVVHSPDCCESWNHGHTWVSSCLPSGHDEAVLLVHQTYAHAKRQHRPHEYHQYRHRFHEYRHRLHECYQ